MENKSKKRILVGLLILLILINLTALGTFIYQKYLSAPKDRNEYTVEANEQHNPHNRLKLYIKKELQLDDEQFRNYCILKDMNIENSAEVWNHLVKFRESNIQEITSPNPDTTRLKELADSIGLYHSKMQLEMNRHYLSVKMILHPDQVSKFNEMIKHADNENWRNQGKGQHNRARKRLKNNNQIN